MALRIGPLFWVLSQARPKLFDLAFQTVTHSPIRGHVGKLLCQLLPDAHFLQLLKGLLGTVTPYEKTAETCTMRGQEVLIGGNVGSLVLNRDALEEQGLGCFRTRSLNCQART